MSAVTTCFIYSPVTIFRDFLNTGEPPRILRWRRRRDSNPRYGNSPYGGLANRWFQPLTHVSVKRQEARLYKRDGQASTAVRDQAAIRSRLRRLTRYISPSAASSSAAAVAAVSEAKATPMLAPTSKVP